MPSANRPAGRPTGRAPCGRSGASWRRSTSRHFASTGVTEDDLPALADAALAGWIPVSPGPWTRDDVLAAYQRALAIESRAVA